MRNRHRRRRAGVALDRRTTQVHSELKGVAARQYMAPEMLRGLRPRGGLFRWGAWSEFVGVCPFRETRAPAAAEEKKKKKSKMRGIVPYCRPRRRTRPTGAGRAGEPGPDPDVWKRAVAEAPTRPLHKDLSRRFQGVKDILDHAFSAA